MNSHKHARLTPKGRALLVERVLDEGWTVTAASQAAGVSRRTAYKWIGRFKDEGPAGLLDRSSRPHRSPRAMPARQLKRCERLRRKRWSFWRIATAEHCSLATLSRKMKPLGLSRLNSLDLAAPVIL